MSLTLIFMHTFKCLVVYIHDTIVSTLFEERNFMHDSALFLCYSYYNTFVATISITVCVSVNIQVTKKNSVADVITVEDCDNNHTCVPPNKKN